jgi:hypothetical protein
MSPPRLRIAARTTRSHAAKCCMALDHLRAPLLKIGLGSHALPIALRIARRTRVANSGTL